MEARMLKDVAQDVEIEAQEFQGANRLQGRVKSCSGGHERGSRTHCSFHQRFRDKDCEAQDVLCV